MIFFSLFGIVSTRVLDCATNPSVSDTLGIVVVFITQRYECQLIYIAKIE